MGTTIRKADVIDCQLALSGQVTVDFEEGGSTVLTPARWVPELANVAPVSLAGPWQVVRWPFPAPERELAAPSAEGHWEEVDQPGKVFYYDPEQSPDGIPGWNRVTLEHLDPQDGAILRRRVAVPREWEGRRILLRFEGLYPAGRIWWDGEPVAEQWSGLTPIEVDLTGLARPGGSHVLAVRFYRRHPSVQLDMPRHALDFVGLCRPAFLHAVEPVHVAGLRLLPELAGDYASGTLRGEVEVANPGGQQPEAVLIARLDDPAGRLVVERGYSIQMEEVGQATVELDLAAGPVRPWSAERPCLYTLSLRLACSGQRDQVVVRRIGFRRLELRDGRPTLNGRPVKFRGVNHLTFHPQGGLFTPEPWLRQNLALMKRANVNAIRTHFFGPRELADLCDEMGLYLLQELPIDWGHTYLHDPTHVGPVLHRLEAGVRRDRDHPSVMVWSVGNENMARNEDEYPVFMEHLRLFGRMVKAMDPTRPTMFPPPGPASSIRCILEARLGEIADIHYSFTFLDELARTGKLTNPRTWGMVPGGKSVPPTFETHTREELLARGWSGAWFSSEYGISNLLADLLHAPYASVIADVMEDPLSGKNTQEVFYGRLSREWGRMRDDPSCLGGAYFCWIAPGAGDPEGWIRWGEDADWGVVTGDLLPKSMFWALRVLFSPVRFPERVAWRRGDRELRLAVHNGYNSHDLSECTLRTQMGGGPPWMGVLREWRDVPMAGAPGSAATVSVPIWNKGSLSALEGGKPIVCRCTVLDPSGFRPITADVLVVPESEQEAAERAREARFAIGPDAAAGPSPQGLLPQPESCPEQT